MCGIGVYVGAKQLAPTRRKKLADISFTTSSHRGPDHSEHALLHNGTVLFLHNRLSLVDLTDAGNQPMAKHGLTIVFNGEIYNFRELRKKLISHGYTFATNTDTEVILSAYDQWGIDCLKHFNGAFVFAIYDPAHHNIVVARDRVGEKPLYYYRHHDGTIMYASSLKQVMMSFPNQWEMNERRIAGDLIFNFWSDKSQSHIKGIELLLPATYHVIDLAAGNAITTTQYWSIPSKNDTLIDEHTAIKETESLLGDSVALRQQMDAPYGVVLSGGLDSTLITELALKSSLDSSDQKMQVYTLHRTGCEDEDSKYALMYSATKRNMDHTLVNISDADMSPRSMIDTTQYMEEPLLDYVYIYINRIYEEAKKSGLKAVLNGQGADELYLGYLDYYPFLRDGNNYKTREDFARHWHTASAPVLSHMLTVKSEEIIDKTLEHYYMHDYEDPLNGVLRFGMRTHLPALLLQEDKQSMRWSVECRTCYTDYRLVELAARIPSRIKMLDNKEKYPIRQVATGHIPSHIINREKLGFPSLNDPKQATIEKLLRQDILRQSSFMRQHFDDKLFDSVDALPFPIKWKLVAIALYDLYFVQPINADVRQHSRT